MHTKQARHRARLIATLNLLRENRKYAVRAMSAAVDVASEKYHRDLPTLKLVHRAERDARSQRTASRARA